MVIRNTSSSPLVSERVTAMIFQDTLRNFSSKPTNNFFHNIATSVTRMVGIVTVAVAIIAFVFSAVATSTGTLVNVSTLF